MAAKYEQLASMLRSEIRETLRWGGSRLPTEAELSQRYRMSRQTVRHALKLLEDEGLVQRRQGSGCYIRQGEQTDTLRQIAVVTTFLDDYIFPSILHDVQADFSAAGYTTLVFATENKVSREREILTQLLERNASAILIEGSKTALPTPNADLFLRLQARHVPVLFLHGIYGNLQGFPCLSDDNYTGGYMLGQYLLAQGHRRIAGIFKSDDVQGPQRYFGLVSALRDGNAAIPDDRILWYDTQDRARLIAGDRCRLLDRFLENRLGDATAVACYNDEIAHLLLKRLSELGRSVPDSLAVVSFDNSFYSQIGPITITSLGHCDRRTGHTAAKLLLDMLSGKEISPPPMAWELIRRQSG